jgi:hypothetical protein
LQEELRAGRHVIPAKAGIQCFYGAANTLDPGFHRGDECSVILGLDQIFKMLKCYGR